MVRFGAPQKQVVIWVNGTEMDLTYINNSRRQFKYVLPVYINFLAVLAFVLISYTKFGSGQINTILLIAGGMAIIMCVPTLIIHLQYNFVNRNSILKVDYTNLVLIYRKDNKDVKINFSDILQIITIITPARHRNRMGFLPWDSYNYSELILHGGDKIYITCYLVDEFQVATEIGTERYRVLYPIIRDRKRYPMENHLQDWEYGIGKK